MPEMPLAAQQLSGPSGTAARTHQERTEKALYRNGEGQTSGRTPGRTSRMGDKSITTTEGRADGHANCAPFTPNENQLRVLTAFQDGDYTCSVTQAMSSSGLSRGTWYYCLGNPDFARWWQEQVERWAAMNLPRVYAALLRRATEKGAPGNTAAIRTFLERFDKDYAPRRRRGGAASDGQDAGVIVVRWADEPDDE